MIEAYTTSGGGKVTDLGFSYTKRGEVSDTYEMTPHSSGYFHLSASYFPNGQLNTFASGALTPSLTYNVDGEGRPWKITASSGQNPVTATAYNTASQVTSVTYGSGDSDSFSFDPNTQLPLGYTINVGAKSQTATITQNANRTMRQLSIADTIFSNQNQTCVFGYDEFLRLTTDKCGTVWGAQYAYDIFGNMAKSTIAGSPGTSFIPTYNISNHYATIPAGAPSYDNNGNLLNDTFHHYIWDHEGNPATIDTYSFTYDALNRRVEYGTGSSFTQFLYAPFDWTRNLGSPAGLRIPTPGGGQAIAGASGVTDYKRPNWQQSQPLDSNTTQTALSDASYTPYGEHYDANGFNGFFGGNLSLYPVFMDGYASTWRLYHFDQGRWISPDPAGLSAVDPANPQTWNRYAYVVGNPLGLTDPSGLGSDPSCQYYSGSYSNGTIWTVTVCSSYVGNIVINQSFNVPPGAGIGPGAGAGGSPASSESLGLSNRQACYADAVVNGALGFVPGYNATKTAASLVGFNFNPVQFLNGNTGPTTGFNSGATPFAAGSPTAPQTLAGIASAGAISANLSYAGAGGAAALTRVNDLISRGSFALQTAARQERLLSQAASLERLATVASAAKNLGTVFSLAYTAFDLYQCSQKQ